MKALFSFRSSKSKIQGVYSAILRTGQYALVLINKRLGGIDISLMLIIKRINARASPGI